MTTEANCLCSGYVLSLLSMAGFNPIIYGRFWVITEDKIRERARGGGRRLKDVAQCLSGKILGVNCELMNKVSEDGI